MEEQTQPKPRRKIWKWIVGILLTGAILASAVWLLLFRANRFALSIQLAGEEEIILEYATSYEEPGAEAIFHGTLFCTEGFSPEDTVVQISGEVDADTLGRYTLSYTADYNGYHAQAQRTVHVIDTECPVITLTEDPEGTILPGTIYQEAGFTAMDNHDGDITDQVVRTEEMGIITYAVVDSSGNPAIAKREIPYHDPLPPEILLEGGETYTITIGTLYEEPGYTAIDNVDGDITAMVTAEGEVDWLTPGTYPITYTVTDAYENTTAITRNVEVTAKPRPETIYPNGKTIYLTFDDGPGIHTEKLLNILDAYGVKATFFVVGTGNGRMMKQIVQRGHSIGIHSVTHTYREIYASPEAYFRDLYRMQNIIYENTGVLTTLLRFPGGSSNEISRNYSEGIMTLLSEAVQDAGFQYFDWNVYSGDAGETQDAGEVAQNVIDGVSRQRVSIVLQHDIHDYSVEAVEDIIIWGLNNGYTFRPLTENSPGFHQILNN